MKGAAKAGLDQFLTYRLHVLNKHADRIMGERYREKLGITLPEARVIAAVGTFGPFSIMDLARHANLDKSQASRAAEALIQRGIVQRRTSDDDGRIVLVSLTTTGRALHRKVMPVARRCNTDLFNCLNDNEKTAFGNALERVIDHMFARGE
jgi:DNA-binding MarR family transcriptional regulator